MFLQSPRHEVGRCSWVGEEEKSARLARSGCILGHIHIDWLLREEDTVAFGRNIGAIIENIRTAVDSNRALRNEKGGQRKFARWNLQDLYGGDCTLAIDNVSIIEPSADIKLVSEHKSNSMVRTGHSLDLGLAIV